MSLAEKRNRKLTEKTRSFGGKLITTGLNTFERNFEKKHLQAYLKGHKIFSFGFSDVPGSIMKEQNWFKVKEIWT